MSSELVPVDVGVAPSSSASAAASASGSNACRQWRTSSIFESPTSSNAQSKERKPSKAKLASREASEIRDIIKDLSVPDTSVSVSAALDSEASSSGDETPISLLERLIRTHRIWFLPSVTKEEAAKLLNGKEKGTFLVRQSSHRSDALVLDLCVEEANANETDASDASQIKHVTVLQESKFAKEDGPRLRLECEEQAFDNILALIYHYSTGGNDRNVLPCALRLPQLLREATSRQSLASVALLGKDFWRYPMSCGGRCASPAVAAASEAATASASDADRRRPQTRPPRAKAEDIEDEEDGEDSANVLDDTLSGLQEVSDLLQASLCELESSRSRKSSTSASASVSASVPAPPPRSTSCSASPKAKPRMARKTSDASLKEMPSKAPPVSSSSSSSQPPIVITPSPARRRKLKNAAKLQQMRTVSPVAQDNKADAPSPATDDAGMSKKPPQRYYRSPMADKMSDYEDIWHDTLPALRRNNNNNNNRKESNDDGEDEARGRRSMTPAESENHFRAYLANKLANEKLASEAENKKASSSSACPPSPVMLYPRLLSPTQFPPRKSSAVDLRSSAASNAASAVPQPTPPKRSSSFSLSGSSVASYNSNAAGVSPSLYSDPLDALERATDTRIYQCLEFGHKEDDDEDEDDEEDDDEKTCKDSSVCGGRATSFESVVSSVNNARDHGKWHLTVSANETVTITVGKANAANSSASVLANTPRSASVENLNDGYASGDVGCSLGRRGASKRKAAHKRSRENRLSAVIGKYIRGGGRPLSSVHTAHTATNSWQVDSSSWEFLGLDNDADVSNSSTNSSSNNSNNVSPASTVEASTPPSRKTSAIVQQSSSLEHSHSESQSKAGVTEQITTSEMTSPSLQNNRKSSATTRCWSKDSVYESGNNDTMTSAGGGGTNGNAGNSDDVVSFPSRPGPAPCHAHPGARDRIESSVRALAADSDTLLARSLAQFVVCTSESKEADPAVVMRNVRQFTAGMKNYLVRNGEGALLAIIEEERAKLQADEFLSVDPILEDVLHSLIVKPLRQHITALINRDLSRGGSLPLLSSRMSSVRCSSRSSESALGAHKAHAVSFATRERCADSLRSFRSAPAPTQKVNHLAEVVMHILNSCASLGGVSVDSFCRLLSVVLVHAGADWAEAEAELTWGLLHPSQLAAEPGYHLAMLSAAVHVIKAAEEANAAESNKSDTRASKRSTASSSSSSTKSSPASAASTTTTTSSAASMRVLVPDELNGTISSKWLPLRPAMTARETARMIAHRTRLTNPEDYALFVLANGKESPLADSQRPFDVLKEASCYFVYKRQDANIVWPREFLG